MNSKFEKLMKCLAQFLTRPSVLRELTVRLTGIALSCVGLVTVSLAQTSTVCDAAGDAIFGSGKGGPQVPGWLDVVQATVADAGDSIVFTISVNAPVPALPSFSGNEEGGQFWWSWRIAGDVTHLTFVKNGCLLSNGKILPAAYFLDLVWSIQAGNFHARLLDNTSCIETEVPFDFSADRTHIIMLVPKALFNNGAIIPDPNRLQYFAGTRIFKADTSNNLSFSEVDNAPDQGSNGFAVGTW